MKTLEMQMASIDSPGIGQARQSKDGPTNERRAGMHTRTNTATRFNLDVKQTEMETEEV